MSDPLPPLEVLPPPVDFCSPVTSVQREASYGFYGPFSVARLAASAADFVLDHCAGDAAGVAQAFSTFLADAAAHAGRLDREGCIEAAWLCVRLTPPTDAWVTPRWHRDGRMFNCACPASPSRPHAKYAVTLRGPPTRLLCPSEAVDVAVRGVKPRYGDGEDEARAELAAALEGMPLVELHPGQVVRFTWGQADAPVHSEPDSSTEDRVFVSVMFGSEKELREMCSFRRVTYGKETIWVSRRSLA
jgi:hypothetical protein